MYSSEHEQYLKETEKAGSSLFREEFVTENQEKRKTRKGRKEATRTWNALLAYLMSKGTVRDTNENDSEALRAERISLGINHLEQPQVRNLTRTVRDLTDSEFQEIRWSLNPKISKARLARLSRDLDTVYANPRVQSEVRQIDRSGGNDNHTLDVNMSWDMVRASEMSYRLTGDPVFAVQALEKFDELKIYMEEKSLQGAEMYPLITGLRGMAAYDVDKLITKGKITDRHNNGIDPRVEFEKAIDMGPFESEVGTALPAWYASHSLLKRHDLRGVKEAYDFMTDKKEGQGMGRWQAIKAIGKSVVGDVLETVKSWF